MQSGTNTAKAPWHLWLVSVLALLWYLSGAYTIMMAQHGSMPGLSAEELAYYAAKPMWLTILADITLIAGIAGAILLLLRSRLAVAAFLVLVLGVAIQNGFELIDGTSLAYGNQGAAIATGVIFILAVLSWLYARAMESRGILT